MAKLPYKTRELIPIGDSMKKLSGFPKQTKKQMSTALRMVQNGATPTIAKPLTNFGNGVYELKSSTNGDTYRVVYLIKLKKGVYLLDAFKKKSKSGKALSKEDSERIKRRVKAAQRIDQG